MARSPSLSVVKENTFDDLITEELETAAAEASIELGAEMGTEGDALDFDDVVAELSDMVSEAVDFMRSTMLPKWEDAERFFDGETDILKVPNRSTATVTVVRDSIRALKPNMMRVFTQSPEVVSYTPANVLDFAAATVAQGQTSYVNQLFWASGGYSALLNSTHNTLLNNSGILKSYYRKVYKDEYVTLTSVPSDQLEALAQMPDVVIVDVVETEELGPPDEMGVQAPMLQVEVAVRKSSGDIALEDVNLNEFFVDEAATSPEDAAVIGETRSVTVGYARSLGLEYDDWTEFDDYDVEMNEDASGAEKRRGYMKMGRDNFESVDESKHKFVLTEAYASFDLDGTGIPQLYRFWLGGTGYEYIAHERVEENPYSVVSADPMPGAFFGRSMFDVLQEDQNTQTSLMRATLDNAHLANNRRLAFHETLVNQQDVMNTALGAPIRFRQAGMIQEIGTESTLGTMLPLLNYMREQSQVKAGSTNAAMGLDPDALQSTDKEAVRNTIQLSQGQVELMCRNMAETGLRTAFTKLLKLSLRHKPRDQVIFSGGVMLPVDQALFDPEMRMEVAVGMGNGDIQMRIAAVQAIIAKQEQIIAQFGLSNPICSITHMLNAVVDLGSMMGVKNMGRYFNQMTPEVAQQLDQMTKQAAEAAKDEPPSAAIAMAEQIRAQSRLQEKQIDTEWEREKLETENMRQITKSLMEDDLARDKMAQDKAIAEAKLLGEALDHEAVAEEQEKAREYDTKKQIAIQMLKIIEAEARKADTPQQPPKT